jgi:hypothetical protein
METEIKYPNVKVKLVGEDGNAFFILGTVAKALRDHGVPRGAVLQFQQEACSGDYGHLLQTCVRWVNVN